MLAKVGSEESRLGLAAVIQLILKDKGVKGLFAGGFSNIFLTFITKKLYFVFTVVIYFVYQQLVCSGVTPRVAWISLGGGIFFGVYEKVKTLL